MRTPEGRPNNIEVRSLKPVREKRAPGWSVKQPETPAQQPANPSYELSEHYRREQERHSGVLENPIRVPRPLPRNLGEQRGEAEPTLPTPAEQPKEAGSKAGPEYDPQLRELAKELFGGITDEAASEFIAMAIRDFPDLPPDEALRKFDRDIREGPFSGFTFP
jgi:hypothetical protein